MKPDLKTETILQAYRKDVEKFARNAYLQTIALKREIETVKINPEDKMMILLHCINLLTSSERRETGTEPQK